MRLVEIKGERNGKINVIDIGSGVVNVPISAYNEKILSVATQNTLGTNLVYYYPNNVQPNPFHYFESQKQYVIFATKTFTLSVNNNFEDKFVFPANTNKINFVQYPFDNFYPLSAFENKISNLVLYSSVGEGMFLNFDKQSFHKGFLGLTKNQSMVFNCISSLVIYNYSLSALEQENDYWILQENDEDRILLE